MNTRLYNPNVDPWPPSPGDTIVFKNGATMVLRPWDENGDSSEVSYKPECLRCDEHLSYDPERTEWVCHSCGHVPSQGEVRKIAIVSAATGNNGKWIA